LLDLDGRITWENSARNEEDTRQFVECMKNVNRKTKSDVNRLNEWFQSKDNFRELYDISTQELIQLLQRLFLNIRKTNGEEYEPDSIKAIQSSIRRHLTYHDHECDIITDPAFRHSRAVIASKHLNEQGLGNKRNRSDPFIDDELAIL